MASTPRFVRRRAELAVRPFAPSSGLAFSLSPSHTDILTLGVAKMSWPELV